MGIDVAVQVEIDVGTGPCGCNADAVMTALVVPPVQLHEKRFVWKDEAVIGGPVTRLLPAFVYLVLHIPDVLEFFLVTTSGARTSLLAAASTDVGYDC
ncbi:hypothetical protein [Pseudomonas chlororaphis]|uniref:hypothetical protein n=1 Tax=Pseudomonas chlororaphis TaxID=587753 RepID=UPI0015DE3E55|nr:hypothetical protein [Pseudomonas chlororaphis]QLL15797.1 hypothetical protein H0I86_12215 [Pseudomonas chlororaphis subsp. aurantiaca]